MQPSPDILKNLLAECEASHLPPPWDSIRCHPAFRCLPATVTPAALVATLLEKNSRDELCAAGVLARPDSAHEVPQLVAHLLHERGYWLALQTASDAVVTDLIAGGQPLGSDIRSLRGPLQDVRAPVLVNKDGTSEPVWAVFSMIDLACLWSLGLPAILGMPLATASKAALQDLCAPSRPGAAPRGLIILGWSLAALDRSLAAPVVTVEQHLLQMQNTLDVDLSTTRIWEPSATTIKDLSFALAYGDRHNVATLLRDEAEFETRALADVFEDVARPLPTIVPLSYLDAYRQLCAARRKCADATHLARLHAQLREAQQREFIEPLLLAATQETDPIRKNLAKQLADAYGELHTLQLQQLLEDCRATTLTQATLEIIRLQKQIRQLIEDLRPWTPPLSTARRPTWPTSSRSLHWGSAPPS